MLKKCTTLLLWLVVSHLPLIGQNQNFFDLTDDLLSEVVIDGKVDYSSLKQKPTRLNQLIELIADYDIEVHPSELKAFYINSYNLVVMHQVIENFPVKSPQDIGGFFDQARYTIGGQRMSLDQLEKILLGMDMDGRMHFILVCAANGCPPLYGLAFRKEDLHGHISYLVSESMENTDYIRWNPETGEVQLPQLFQWYPEDLGKTKEEQLNTINKYRNRPIPLGAKVSYYTYDWSLNDSNAPDSSDGKINIQAYTPSKLLGKGQWEFKSFANLYTQTKMFDDNGGKVSTGRGRESYLTVINQFSYGLNKKWNVGLDLWFKKVQLDPNEDYLPIDIIGMPEGLTGRGTVSSVGPKIKLAPFNRWSNISFQSTFLIPLANDLEGNATPDGDHNDSPFLDFDRYLWINYLYYDGEISSKFTFFGQLSAWTSFVRSSSVENTFVETPISLFLTYFATDRLSFYMLEEIWIKHLNGSFSSYFNQIGLGSKYQVIPGLLETELLYTNFALGSPGEGAGETFNLGIRIIH